MYNKKLISGFAVKPSTLYKMKLTSTLFLILKINENADKNLDIYSIIKRDKPCLKIMSEKAVKLFQKYKNLSG